MARRKISFFNDLGLQLLTLYLLIIIPSLAILLVFDYVAGERIQADVRANDLSLARAIALETDLSISKSLQAVDALSKMPSIQESDIDGMEKVLTSLAKPARM